MSLENFVRDKVSDNLVKKQKVNAEVGFDPAIILVIVQVLTTLLKDCPLFKNKKASQIKETAKKVGPWERFALKVHVRNAIDDNRVFKLYGPQIISAIAEAGPEATEFEIQSALDDVRDSFQTDEEVVVE